MSWSIQDKSTNVVFKGFVAVTDGLFIKDRSSSVKDTESQIFYYSGSKSSYGLNCLAMFKMNYRFYALSFIAPSASNDWVAWNRSGISTAVQQLPKCFYVLGTSIFYFFKCLVYLHQPPEATASPTSAIFQSHEGRSWSALERSSADWKIVLMGLAVRWWKNVWRSCNKLELEWCCARRDESHIMGLAPICLY